MRWTEGITDYTVDRGVLGTLVTVRLSSYESERTLYLGYEGFLELDQEDALILGRDELWFPEFSIPTSEPKLIFGFPEGWHQVVSAIDHSYPTLILTRHPDRDWDADLTARITEPELPTMVTEPLVTEPEPVPDHLPSLPPPIPEPTPPQVALSVVPDAVYGELSNLVLRMDRAISQQDTAALAELVGPRLQAAGLIEYFSAVPSHILPVESQIRDLVVTDAEGIVKATMFSRGRPTYDLEMRWMADQAGSWQLAEFAMHPHEPAAPQALIDSLKGFVAQLREAAAAGDAYQIEEVLGLSDPGQRGMAIEFLLALNAEEPWEVFVTDPDQFRLQVLVRHSVRTHIVLNLELAPEPTGWRIASFHAQALN